MHLENMVISSLLNHEMFCISLVNYNNQFGIITCSKRVMIASNVMTHPQHSYLPIYALEWDYFYFGFYEFEVRLPQKQHIIHKIHEMNLAVVMFMGHEFNKVERAKLLPHPKPTS
jgi:hypothetical protein